MAISRGLSLFRSFTSPHFSSVSELVVIVCDPQHDCLRRVLLHRLSKHAHLLTPLPPMIGVIGQHARRRWWIVTGHWNLARQSCLRPTWRSSRNFRQRPALAPLCERLSF